MEKLLVDLIGDNFKFIVVLIVCCLPLGFLLPYALVAILAELKISAWIQDRLGPMRTGPWGILQPIAEVVKLLQKENITPANASTFLYNTAPFVIFTGSYVAFAAIPFSSEFVAADINVGVFYLLAVSALAVVGILMGGWASHNKYSLYGAIRSVSQIISYEIPAAIALLAVVTLAGSMSLQEINHQQSGWFWNWYVFGGPGSVAKIVVVPFTMSLALIYFIATLAETNRTPFDLPEGESEIIAGYHTEYSGIKFAMFFFAEYANMFVVSAVLVSLFLGGWNSPFGDFLQGPILGFFWFVSKSAALIVLQIWLRWTLPRLRVDQLMYLCWKVLLPISLVCFFAVGFYRMLF
jgi:NADH-quinone oxidoreductase subunit H